MEVSSSENLEILLMQSSIPIVNYTKSNKKYTIEESIYTTLCKTCHITYPDDSFNKKHSPNNDCNVEEDKSNSEIEDSKT